MKYTVTATAIIADPTGSVTYEDCSFTGDNLVNLVEQADTHLLELADERLDYEGGYVQAFNDTTQRLINLEGV